MQLGHAGACRAGAGRCLWGCEHACSHGFVDVLGLTVTLLVFSLAPMAAGPPEQAHRDLCVHVWVILCLEVPEQRSVQTRAVCPCLQDCCRKELTALLWPSINPCPAEMSCIALQRGGMPGGWDRAWCQAPAEHLCLMLTCDAHVQAHSFPRYLPIAPGSR